jgi:hypothetical protein
MYGRVEEAGQSARQVLDLARHYGAGGSEACALCQLGAVHAQTEPPGVPQGEARSRQALALAEELRLPPLQAHCHLGLGTLYAQIGRLEPAHAYPSAALELYRAMEVSFWLPRLEATLAECKGVDHIR